MTAKFDPRDWNAALHQLKDEAGAPTQVPRPRNELEQHDQFKVKVIEARVKLKLMRDRTEALKEALERYRQRQGSMRA